MSDKFEEAGKFGNKLWNVSRLCLMNLEGYDAQTIEDADLAFEDRWILSRLATVTQKVTNGLDNYKYARAPFKILITSARRVPRGIGLCR